MITTISKGLQITIPSELRKELNLRIGSKVEIIRKQDAVIIKPIGEDLESLFANAKKIKPKRNLSAKQMDEMIENEVLRQ